jgi:hypothetical protein
MGHHTMVQVVSSTLANTLPGGESPDPLASQAANGA